MGELAEKSEEQIAEDRLGSVLRQVRAAQSGKSSNPKILCPYCGHWNFMRGRRMCCHPLRHAIIAILVGDRAMKNAEIAERAANN
jgi:DNA-directed RNA polymerase subunit RPC12/RpoP